MLDAIVTVVGFFFALKACLLNLHWTGFLKGIRPRVAYGGPLYRRGVPELGAAAGNPYNSSAIRMRRSAFRHCVIPKLPACRRLRAEPRCQQADRLLQRQSKQCPEFFRATLQQSRCQAAGCETQAALQGLQSVWHQSCVSDRNARMKGCNLLLPWPFHRMQAHPRPNCTFLGRKAG